MICAPRRLLVWILLGAIAVRLVLYWSFPSFLTDDSGDYLLAARALAGSFDFASSGLRDWRVPGYSLFLALVQPYTALQSDRIVAVQVLLGVLTVLLGFVVGVASRSALTAVGLALFLAFNPIYLLFEHAVMSEALAIAALLGFLAAVVWSCSRPRRAWLCGAVVAALFAFCVLTRANLMAFCAICLVAPPACWAVQEGLRGRLWRDAVLRFTAAVLAVLIVLVGPWLLRNYQMYGQASMLVSLNRNLFLYKAFYEPVDSTLPKLQAINRDLGAETVDYEWLWKLAKAYPPKEAEAIAFDLWWEQIAAHPTKYVGDLWEAAAAYAGYDYSHVPELAAVQDWWLSRLMADRSRLDENNRRFEGLDGFHYVAAAGQGALTDALLSVWARVGVVYIRNVRWPSTAALLLAFGWYVWKRWRRGPRNLDNRDMILAVIMTAYLANAAAHVVTLAVSDRFASMFDFVAVFLLLLAVDALDWPNTLTAFGSGRLRLRAK